MKVIVGDKVYLQKVDLAYMIHEFNGLPSCIMSEAFGTACILTTNGADDAVSFGYCFESERAVSFLRANEQILDFSVYSQKSTDSLIALKAQLESDLDREVDKFNESSEDFRKKHYDEYSERFDYMRLQILNLDFLIDCKNGKIKMPAIPTADTKFESNGFTRIKVSGLSEDYDEESKDEAGSKKSKLVGFFCRLFKGGAQ